MGFFERHGGLARYTLYVFLLLWSILLFVLCCVRLGYTTRFRNEPSLNRGRPFYDPSVVELLACSILGSIFGIMIVSQLGYRRDKDHLAKNWFEVGGLAILWLLWLGGAGAATTVWPNLSWCIQYSPCLLLQFLMAFAWLGWLTLTVLLFTTLWIHKTRGVEWNGHHFDAWGHKALGSNPTPIEHERETGQSRAGSTRLKAMGRIESKPPNVLTESS